MDYAELERRTMAHMLNVRGREGTGRTSYTGRLPRGLREDIMESMALGRAAMRLIDFSFAYASGRDDPENVIEFTDYPELPPEQLLLPPGEGDDK